jgi:hypothetical protein
MVTIATTEESYFVGLGLVAEKSVLQDKIQSCRIKEDEFRIAGLYGRAPLKSLKLSSRLQCPMR